MTNSIPSDLSGAGSQRLYTRGISSPPGAAGVHQPARHLIEEVAEIRPSSRATGAEVETDIVHTHRAAAADDMLASLEQASADHRSARRKPEASPDARPEAGSRPGRGRVRREPYKAESRGARRIDLLA